MAGNLAKWPSGRGPISKTRPSDGRGSGTVPLAVERWYDFHGFGCHLGECRLIEPPHGRPRASAHAAIT